MNKEKFIKLITNKGLYVLLALGICVTVYTAFMNKRNTEWMKENEIKYEASAIADPKLYNTNEADIEKEEITISDNYIVNEEEKAEYETVSKNVDEEKEDENFIPSLKMPASGEIVAVFSVDELVYDKTMNDWRTHNGVDISGKRGAQVKAAEKGTVKEIKQTEEMGFTIVIEHKNGYKTVYSNLQKGNVVNIGDNVEKGDVIGGIGETAAFESGSVPHVHFSLMKEDKYLNPLDYAE